MFKSEILTACDSVFKAIRQHNYRCEKNEVTVWDCQVWLTSKLLPVNKLLKFLTEKVLKQNKLSVEFKAVAYSKNRKEKQVFVLESIKSITSLDEQKAPMHHLAAYKSSIYGKDFKSFSIGFETQYILF